MEAFDPERRPLWNAGFLKIVLAHFLVGVSLYMFLPVVPLLAGHDGGGEAAGVLWSAVLFCAGMCVPAPFCNYWLDTFRRRTVALWGLAGMVCAVALFGAGVSGWVGGAVRLLQGAAYGVFQIAAGSTLLLDLSDPKKRTAAAHVYYWFQRLALVAGLLAGRPVASRFGLPPFLWLAGGLLVCAVLLVGALRVPFRAPLCPSPFSLDRFWLPRGSRLFVPFVLASCVAGALLARIHTLAGFFFLAVGFWVALTLHLRVFRERLELEIGAGFLLLFVSCLLFLSPPATGVVSCAAALSLGCGQGCIASRYLLSYIRVCEHCERGTAQTSYLLGWDVGLLVGYSLSLFLSLPDGRVCVDAVPGICLLAALVHFAFVRKWYISHRRK